MTLVAVWRYDENRLMAVADTRIIRDADNVLTEHGPKILPIKVRGKQPGPDGFFNQVAFDYDLGFSYSGATLPALSSHALASALLANLNGPPGAPPPSMEEIANFIGDVCTQYMREVGALSGNNALFSAIVFGYCYTQQRLLSFEIRPRVGHELLRCEVIERSFDNDDSIVIIGSCPDLLRRRITEDREAAIARGDVSPILEMNRPSRVLQYLINENADESVGGMIQQGWATPAGFELVATGAAINPHPPSTRNLGLFVLGFDIAEMAYVGANFIGLTTKI